MLHPPFYRQLMFLHYFNQVIQIDRKEFTIKRLRSIFSDTTGSTAIEYCLILGLISVAALAALDGLSGQLQATYDTLSSALRNA